MPNQSHTTHDVDPAGAVYVRAYAKVNLALSVSPPQPPKGYHLISSLFVGIDLFDDVRLVPATAQKGSLAVRWAADAPRPSLVDWPMDKDLAYLAMRAAVDDGLLNGPLDIELVKRIPTGGGLGGGSADAAAVLRAVFRQQAWHGAAVTEQKTDLRSALVAIAMKLGSDIAYFCDFDADGDPAPISAHTSDESALTAPPRAAVVGGYGESIARLSITAVTDRAAPGLVLLFPSVGCPTGAVYGAFDAMAQPGLRADAVERVASGLVSGHLADEEMFNDLAEPAMAVAPSLRALRAEASEACGRRVHITGSGSTMFIVVAEGDQQAAAVAESLRDVCQHHHAGVVVSRLVW